MFCSTAYRGFPPASSDEDPTVGALGRIWRDHAELLQVRESLGQSLCCSCALLRWSNRAVNVGAELVAIGKEIQLTGFHRANIGQVSQNRRSELLWSHRRDLCNRWKLGHVTLRL